MKAAEGISFPALTPARLKSRSFRSGERKPEDKVITPKMARIMLETELHIIRNLPILPPLSQIVL